MGTNNLSELDILAVASSGVATEKMYNFLQGLKNDVVNSYIGNTASIYHRATSTAVATANASDEATAIVLANGLKGTINRHLASEGNSGVHLVASAAAIAAADATDLATAITLANEIKADYNTHLSEAGVHLANDATNIVAAVDATDQATLETLLNEIKADYNLHIAGALESGTIS